MAVVLYFLNDYYIDCYMDKMNRSLVVVVYSIIN